MPETLTTPQQMQHAPERKRGDIAERVWDSADQHVRGRLTLAHRYLQESEEDFNNLDLVQLAYADQERALDEADLDDMTTSELTSQRIALMMLEMPFAAEAQAEFRKGNFSTARERLEAIVPLSQFNKDFAAALDYMPKSMLVRFPEQAWFRAATLHQKMGLPVLKGEDYEAIVKGLSKEVAVSRAIHTESSKEWVLEHATVEEDLSGVDLHIANETSRISLDVKSAKTFEHTLQKLYDKGLIDKPEQQNGLHNGYVRVNYNPGTPYETHPWIIDADRLGKINQFEYDDPTPVVALMHQLFEEQKATA